MDCLIQKKHISIRELNFYLDLSLSQGRLNLFTGRNGIGKSSLLNYFSQQLPSKSYCLQSPLKSLNSLRVQDLLHTLGVTDTKLIESFDLQLKLQRQINHLSGGENQALKLIIALALPKDVYLFDEPFQNLDRDKMELLTNLLIELGKRKLVIVIDHQGSFEGVTDVNHFHAFLADGRVEVKNV